MSKELQTHSQALDLAVQLGNVLRHVHDEVRIPGALTPDVVNLTGSHLELLPAKPVPHHNQFERALRTEMELLESRLVSKLDRCEGAIADLRRDFAEELAKQREEISDALQGLRGRIDVNEPHLNAVLERSFIAERAAERALGEIAGIHGAVSAELQGLTDKINAQSAAIESGRAGIARTDDLVERVVEALEVIQGMVIEQAEERAALARS